MGLFTRTLKVDPLTVLKEMYERQIALLQEQLSDARSDAQRHCERADAAADHLIRLIGLPAISRMGKQEAAEAAEKIRVHAEKAARVDMFDDLPFEGGDGVFRNRQEAELM